MALYAPIVNTLSKFSFKLNPAKLYSKAKMVNQIAGILSILIKDDFNENFSPAKKKTEKI